MKFMHPRPIHFKFGGLYMQKTILHSTLAKFLLKICSFLLALQQTSKDERIITRFTRD